MKNYSGFIDSRIYLYVKLNYPPSEIIKLSEFKTINGNIL